MEDLVNKTIKQIFLDGENQYFIKFFTDEGEIVYQTHGDCCSESWFADIINVDALLNAKISVVEKVYLPEAEPDGRERQEYDAYYGIKLTTDKGNASIVYRNSSNGYYGGWISLYKGSEKVEWVEITEDYPN